LAVTRVRRPQHRDGANSKWGSDRKRSAEYLTPRSRKERVQALSVPGTEKFEGELWCRISHPAFAQRTRAGFIGSWDRKIWRRTLKRNLIGGTQTV